VEVDGVLVDVLQEELVRRLTVFVELDLAVLVVQVQKRVQRVVIQLFGLAHRLSYGLPHSVGHGFRAFLKQ